CLNSRLAARGGCPAVGATAASRRARLMGFVEHDPAGQSQLAAFRGSLKRLGWKEGTNLELNSAGPPLMRIELGRWQKSLSICSRMRFSVRPRWQRVPSPAKRGQFR